MRLKTINETINEYRDGDDYKLMGMGSETDKSRYDYNRGIVRFRGAEYYIIYNKDGSVKEVYGFSQKSRVRDAKDLTALLIKNNHNKSDQPQKEPNNPEVEALAQQIIDYLEKNGLEIVKASVSGKRLKITTSGVLGRVHGGKSENTTNDLREFLDQKGIKYGFGYGSFGSATFTLTIGPKLMTALKIDE